MLQVLASNFVLSLVNFPIIHKQDTFFKYLFQKY